MPSICSNCYKDVESVDLFWTYRFGYPFKKVCGLQGKNRYGIKDDGV